MKMDWKTITVLLAVMLLAGILGFIKGCQEDSGTQAAVCPAAVTEELML